MNPTTKKIISEVSMLILTQVVVFIGFRYLVNKFDPQSDQKKQAQEKSKTLTNKLQLKNITLNEYEKIIMGEVILPDDLKVTFSDIGGLDDIIGELKESVIYPLNHPQLFSSTMDLFGSPKGVLLYGPPGCGKTMLAKALAKESRARFINLHLSTLMDKWFGESNRLVKAVFTLADKLQPTIIFIDEIDSLFRTRESRDHEATSMMKAEFMSLWDGLATDSGNRVL
ncbi:ATPase family AAA domain-containing protein 1, partial [Zancudomyces culisetae]